MAKKKVIKLIKLQIQSGKANPAPPIGPALGAAGVNIMGFCKEFNAKTQGSNDILPVVITVYQDKSFSFITKKPPVPQLILEEAKLKKGSAVPNRDKVGKLNRDQMIRIYEKKKEDFRLKGQSEEMNLEAGLHIIAGTARSMGIDTEF